MTDCPNAEIRDQLPDLVHGHLDQLSRARVEAHLRECADCRQELALLRQIVHAAPVVPVDVAGIVAALPAPRARRRLNSRVWQMAAAVVFLAAGGSVVVREMGHSGAVDSTRAAVVASNHESAAGNASANDVELSVGYGYSDLTDAQLQTLLKDVEKMSATPMTDPDASLPDVTVSNGGL